MIEQVEGHITTPSLAVPIPGFDGFSSIQVQGSEGQRYLDIPFLAQYISAVYTYALGIIVTIATVMVVIGGVKWMLARGDSGKVSDAKETLSRAVIGVLLALGSYAILNLINPELVNLRALRIQLVERRDVIDQSLLANTGDNSDPDTRWTSSGGSTAGATSPSASTGSNISIRSSGTCPVTLPEEENRRRYEDNPRSQEFMRQIQTVITGGTREERIVRFLDAAAACRVYLGSCLHSAEIANGFGINRPGTLIGRGRTTNSVPPSQFSTLRNFRCTSSQPECNMGRQRATVFAQLKSAISGYPDNWFDDLAAGDSIVVFNANRLDTNGNHTQVFVGWLDRARGRARVLQGSPGTPVRWGNVCLSERCGAPFPLIKTFRARE